MSEFVSSAVSCGQGVLPKAYDEIKTYVSYIKKCEENLGLLLEQLETLRAEKVGIDKEVRRGKEKLETITAKAKDWLKLVKKLVKYESMKLLMNKDMRIAKVMLRLLEDDLKKLVEKDGGEMRGVVVKVMKDIAKRKREAANREVSDGDEKDKEAGNSEVSDVDDKDKQVCQLLEKLVEETIGEFKKLMRDDVKMAIAAMNLLENHMEKLEKPTEKDQKVADIIANATKMSDDEELLSDSHDDDDDVSVKTLKAKVTNLLKPLGNIILNEELLMKTLPENVRVGIEAMGVVIGNRRELKAELMDSNNKTPHRNCCWPCCSVISYNYFSDRYHMSVAAKTMLDKTKDIIGKKPDIENVTRPKRRGEMEGVPTYCVGLESRNDLYQQIIKALASNDVHALGVTGMGGSGKTILAKEIFNSKAGGTFETAVMVEISVSPNIEFIQDQIGGGFGLEMHKAHGISEKATLIYNRLKPEEGSQGGEVDNNAKKILIVLDNIWNKINLLQIGIPPTYCKLLLTSRTKDVCEAMDVQEILEVGLLNEDEAKDLFKFQFQKEVTGEYNIVADRLLKKCRGLPLAIVATANSLKGKELPFWRQFADELEKPIACQIPGVLHETFSILKTSYEVMASEEKKKFFLMACLSPIGTSISIDNLMRYGIGLGLFQHVNKLSEAIDCARTWTEELVSSSMLLKGDSDEYVKIHDVVRESTISFASKSGINTDGQMLLVDAIPRWIFEETINKYTGISLLAQPNYAPLSGVEADLLQILLFKGDRGDDAFLESNFFLRMTNLKVLEMRYMNFEKGLPESLCNLKILKTLHLVECKLGDIKMIGELGSLLVLSLHGSSLEGLPDEIGKLYKLRLLDLSKCHCKERIPANVIARLSLLEGLYLVGSSFTEWAVKETTSSDTRVSTLADIEDLAKLDFLNVLEIQLRELVLPICDQFVKNLDKFQIFVRQEDFGQKDFELPPSQRALMVSKFDVSQELKKDNCLKALLKKVDFLALKSATVKNIVPELDKEGFRDLSSLLLHEIDSITRICEGKAPTELFYNLCHLVVSELEKLEVLLPVNPLPRKMTTLQISHCENLTYIFSEDGVVNKESDIIKLPCLKKLELDGVTNLISMVKESNNDDGRGRPSFFNCKVTLTALEELSLKYNGNIVKLWDKESNMQSFQNLKDLEISNCKEMETLGTPSMFLSLVQLESLKIERCEKMQQVISDGSETQEIPKEVITFPKLKRLNIKNMENLVCFYGGSYKMAFPRLENLDLSSLERMTKFAGGINSTAFFPETVTMTSLEELSLKNKGRIVKLWDKESNLHSFQNLKDLKIINCKEMETIGPPSMFLSLVQLESLEIECCEKMQQVIIDGSETQEILIEFPKLKYLSINHMKNLECFYGGSYKMSFPRLEKLNLFSLTRMTKFVGGVNSTAFFPNTIEFPCLENLHLHEVSDEVRVIWELHEGEGQGISSNPLPNLRRLNVAKVKLPSIVFPSLSYLYIREPVIGDAKFLFSSSSSENEGCVGTYSQFPKLEELNIEGCSNSALQFVKDDDGSTALLNFCGQLRILKLYSTSNLEMTCSHSFKSLRQLIISGLKSEYLFSVDRGFGQLQSLEELSIKNCPNMKVIIQGGDKDKAVVFPRLKKLWLSNLKSMSKLCSISDIPLRFPSLENLCIDSCNKLESLFCGEPNQVVELPALDYIIIRDCNTMKSFSTRPLKAPKLRRLKVHFCPEMEWFLAGNLNCDADLELSSLEEVFINSCLNMKSFSPALLRAPRLRKINVAGCEEWIFNGETNQVVELPSLEQVTISKCDAMKSFSTMPLNARNLRELYIFECLEMDSFLLGNSNWNADVELPSLEC